MPGDGYDAAMRRLIPAITIAWAACFVYLGVVARVPEPAVIGSSEIVEGLGHLVATLVLAVLVAEWILGTSGRSRTRAGAAGAILALGVALALEAVQLLLPDRGVELVDVVLDIAGAAAGALLFVNLDRLRLGEGTMTRIAGWMGVGAIGVAVFTIALGPSRDMLDGGTHPVCNNEPAVARPLPGGAPDGDRVETGLLAEYRFNEGSGAVAHNQAGADLELDLDLGPGVEWASDGSGVIFPSDGLIRSESSAEGIAASVAESGAFTAEVWVAPWALRSGPARIVSISGGSDLSQVDFHVGQEGRCLSVRLRQSERGDPEWFLIESVFVERAVRHIVVVVSDRDVQTFANGILIDERRTDGPVLDGWRSGFPLLIGNEASSDRPFSGQVFWFAAYDRALTAAEVAGNFAAGPRPSF